MTSFQRIQVTDLQRANVQFSRDIEYAQRSQSHLWTAMVTYKVSQSSAEKIVKGEGEPMFDYENLVMLNLGCFICEEPMDQKIMHRRCPGEPPQ